VIKLNHTTTGINVLDGLVELGKVAWLEIVVGVILGVCKDKIRLKVRATPRCIQFITSSTPPVSKCLLQLLF
jgi:hypothetical protein